MALGTKSVTIGQVMAMTVITPILPDRLETLRAVLAQPLGPVLADIGTIHFARWVIINRDKDLLFTSNFDGSWEVYLRDFTRLTPDGLDAIWSNCRGYPRGGAREFDAFRAYVDDHEVRTDAFYPAYPHLTVKAIAKHETVYRQFNDLLNQFG